MLAIGRNAPHRVGISGAALDAGIRVGGAADPGGHALPFGVAGAHAVDLIGGRALSRLPRHLDAAVAGSGSGQRDIRRDGGRHGGGNARLVLAQAGVLSVGAYHGVIVGGVGLRRGIQILTVHGGAGQRRPHVAGRASAVDEIRLRHGVGPPCDGDAVAAGGCAAQDDGVGVRGVVLVLEGHLFAGVHLGVVATVKRIATAGLLTAAKHAVAGGDIHDIIAAMEIHNIPVAAALIDLHLAVPVGDTAEVLECPGLASQKAGHFVLHGADIGQQLLIVRAGGGAAGRRAGNGINAADVGEIGLTAVHAVLKLHNEPPHVHLCIVRRRVCCHTPVQLPCGVCPQSDKYPVTLCLCQDIAAVDLRGLPAAPGDINDGRVQVLIGRQLQLRQVPRTRAAGRGAVRRLRGGRTALHDLRRPDIGDLQRQQARRHQQRQTHRNDPLLHTILSLCAHTAPYEICRIGIHIQYHYSTICGEYNMLAA